MPLLARLIALAVAILPAIASAADRGAVDAAFQRWLADEIAPSARADGVSQATLDALLTGLTPDWSLPDLAPPGGPEPTATPQWQAEFRSPARYLDDKRLAGLAREGRTRIAAQRDLFTQVEARFGVPAPIVAAIWARESDFGRAPLKYDALRTLATQAFMGSRKSLFRPEFLAMLRVMEADRLPRSLVRSSWAGALGQPQFLPTKLETHAVDFDGDGRRDIWASDADVAGSIGHYLKDFGWQSGVAVAVEVAVPDAVSCTLEGPDKGRPMTDWAALGVTGADGRPLTADRLGRPDANGHLLMPAGRKGPAFLVSENFYVLKAYNESDLYALFISHLAERMADPKARITGRWSKVDGLTRGDIRDLQLRLQTAGHDTGGADGLVGWRTRVAIGRAQEAAGRPATCFPEPGL